MCTLYNIKSRKDVAGFCAYEDRPRQRAYCHRRPDERYRRLHTGDQDAGAKIRNNLWGSA